MKLIGGLVSFDGPNVYDCQLKRVFDFLLIQCYQLRIAEFVTLIGNNLTMAVGGALFGPSTTRTSGPKALVEFRAGKMTFNESTKMVSPDK